MGALLDILEPNVKKVRFFILNVLLLHIFPRIYFFLTYLFAECPSGTFGLDCDNKCNLYCTGNTSCNHVTGVCIEGCKKGWKGPLCNGGNIYGLNKKRKTKYLEHILLIFIITKT